jgi:hypothetical protein
MLWRFSRLAGNPPLYPVTAAQIAIIFVSFEKERSFYALDYEATAVISRTRIFNISHAQAALRTHQEQLSHLCPLVRHSDSVFMFSIAIWPAL